MPMSEQRIELIRHALEASLNALEIDVIDDSHLHAGHAGARDGRGHFRVSVVAECFRDMSPIKRHRTVYAALGDLMSTDIHAVSIDARAPDA
jgi:BolA protein